MGNLYQDHNDFIQANTVTSNNMVPNHPTQLQIAQQLFPYYEIAFINFGKKLYGCKVVDYHYRSTSGKEGEIIINFADPDSAAHLFGAPLTQTRSGAENQKLQLMLERFFNYIRVNGLDKNYIEPVEDVNINSEISIIETQLKLLIMTLSVVTDIDDPILKNTISDFTAMLNDFECNYSLKQLTIKQANRLATIIATAKIEIENANRANINLQDVNSPKFKTACFDVLAKFNNKQLSYLELVNELAKTFKICVVYKNKVIPLLQNFLNLQHYYAVDNKLKSDLFDDGIISFIDSLKNPDGYWQFVDRDEQEILSFISIIDEFYEFMGLNESDLNKFMEFITNNYQNINTNKIQQKLNNITNRKYEKIIDEILAILALKNIPISSINNGSKLKEFYTQNFTFFSIQITNIDDFNEIVKIIKNYKPTKNYDIQINQILNSFDISNSINFFITQDQNFTQEHKITQYYILEQLENKGLDMGLNIGALPQIFEPNTIQSTYILTMYQLKLEKIAACYECYQDYLNNKKVTTTHNWLAILYELLGSQDFMNFIKSEPLIPNFAKMARKLSLVTTICNIGEIDYEIKIGTPTNGKRDKNIYSLKFGRQVSFGQYEFQKGKQIVLEIELDNGLYKVNSLKTDSPVETKNINGLKFIRIVYLINDEALALLRQLGLEQQMQIVSPRKIL